MKTNKKREHLLPLFVGRDYLVSLDLDLASIQGVTLAAMTHFSVFLLALSVAVLSVPSSLFAEEFHNALSLEGFTGLLNTPNAEVINDGEFSGLYSNQKENGFRSRLAREDSYLFSMGFLPFAEIVGRLTDTPDGKLRDLSGSLKVKLLPDVAIGVQDVGGGSSFFRTKYAVATETWQRFRMSLGYGSGPDRMKGLFGGVEFKTTDWLTMIGENDTREANVGLRIITPALFGWPVQAQVTAKTSLAYHPGNMEFGIGFQFPLGNKHENRTPLQSEATTLHVPEQKLSRESNQPVVPAGPEKGPSQVPKKEGAGRAAPPLRRDTLDHPRVSQHSLACFEKPIPPRLSRGAGQTEAGNTDRLRLLFDKLVSNGFQNVSVGIKGDDVLVVEYENGRYHHNELDGLGVVIGMVIDIVPKSFETLRVIVKKENLGILRLSAPLEAFRAFLQDSGAYGDLNKKLSITRGGEDTGDVSVIAGPGNPSRLTSSLVLYPGLKTFVGTEVGVFDYLLSAKADYFVNAWNGAVFNARWDIPIAWSGNFDNGRAYRANRQNSRLDRFMLFQALTATPSVMIDLSAGMIQPDTYGTLNEMMWTPGDGTQRFSLKQAYASNRDKEAPFQKHELYLGSYRYYFSPFDLSLKGTVGKFFDNDIGFSLELKRFFGDTALSVYYKNSRTVSQEHVQVAGLLISLPLTPRRDMKPGLVQVRGSEEWSYYQETKIVSRGGGGNFVSTSIGNDLSVPNNLDRVFFNRNRLSEPYIRKHLLRLRDAYMTYRQSNIDMNKPPNP
ncbi:Exopolysaccharide biosynthesis protein YbjH [Gammaproteobacteria bacterium]